MLRNKFLNNQNKTENNTIYTHSKENKILTYKSNQTRTESLC